MIQVVFWVVTPCSDVVRYQNFGGPCCLNLQGNYAISSKVTNLIILGVTAKST